MQHEVESQWWTVKELRRIFCHWIRKGVREMREAGEERSRRIVTIKEGAKTHNDGRSHFLPGLRACRLTAAITQRELAARIGSTQATVRELERGRRGAYVSTLRKLCGVLGVAPEDLLCGSGDEHKEARR